MFIYLPLITSMEHTDCKWMKPHKSSSEAQINYVTFDFNLMLLLLVGTSFQNTVEMYKNIIIIKQILICADFKKSIFISVKWNLKCWKSEKWRTFYSETSLIKYFSHGSSVVFFSMTLIIRRHCTESNFVSSVRT